MIYAYRRAPVLNALTRVRAPHPHLCNVDERVDGASCVLGAGGARHVEGGSAGGPKGVAAARRHGQRVVRQRRQRLVRAGGNHAAAHV